MSKSSVARRQRRLALKPLRGRPSGTFRPLLKDPQRFTVAAWLLLEPVFGPRAAGRLAIVAFEEKTPIEFTTLEGAMVMSFTYLPPQGAPAADFDEQARSLEAKAKLLASRATAKELDWLIASSAALLGLIGFMAVGNWLGVRLAQKSLQQAGWGDLLARIGRRFDLPADMQSLRPFDKNRLRAAGRRLLAAIKAGRLSASSWNCGQKAKPHQWLTDPINSP
jgi:hypothetical protein